MPGNVTGSIGADNVNLSNAATESTLAALLKIAQIDSKNLIEIAKKAFPDIQLKDFEEDSPIINRIGEWYNVKRGDKNYTVLIQGDDLGSIIVLETDNIEDVDGGHGYKLAPYDEWDEFEEIMEIITK